VILAYNGEKTIKDCLDSVLGQTYDNVEIIVVDNASTDGTKKIIVSQYEEIVSPREIRSPKIRIIQNKENIGFAGHNIGIDSSAGKFVLCVNQDAVLKPDFVSEAVKLFQDDRVGAVQGKILKKEPTQKIIDTTGIIAFRSRRFADRGQGEKDQGQYERTEEVFGCNGAVAFFRKGCLEDVKLGICRGTTSADRRGRSSACGEYYDPDFFMYKEDIDLSWRIRLYGWKIVYCPAAVAYVERSSKFIDDGGGAKDTISARKAQCQFVRSSSFKNHRLAIIKNDLPWLFVKHLPWILPREIGVWLYVLFFEPKTWPAIGELFGQMLQAWKKRKIIMANKKVGADEMEKWFK
jgi:GT2 family glycosyltransferase